MHFRCKFGISKTVETNCKHKIISQFIIYKLSNIIYTSFIFNILHIIIYIIIRANVNIYIYKRIEEENIHCLFAATVKVGSSRLIQSDSCVHYITIGKPRVSPLLSLNTSAVIRYLICVYASHFFAGRPYHFNQTLRTANKF